ncbi:hypothetical protein M427DRAFT_130714 [Gonapodya prolifera JEL478]|uniref:PhoD-like phosphatase metallophosphatase domain-containing protein n=1 Tax=Gonapodya prolifera (strain JEL478) TaxID=1344416 RepID=A0A139AWR7_GONPJ|nr:hypothetical protein M427DRAFT_130714 [Gonapodya prolifera JEL478]|eukprot:KXS21147.1 hypothetical protein M427DRAFT_130714 [Gonapodya prolifera JEL478]
MAKLLAIAFLLFALCVLPRESGASVALLKTNVAFSPAMAAFPRFGHDIAQIARRRLERRSAAENSSNDTLDTALPVFQFGVASGDPTSTSVILWTRAAPRLVCISANEVYSAETRTCKCAPSFTRNNVSLCVGGTGPDSPVRNITVDSEWVLVQWEISEDRSFGLGVCLFSSTPTHAVDVQNLKPDRIYFYRFVAPYNRDIVSSIGRTRTLPEPNKKVTRPWRLAVYSCANLPQGYFNAYGNTARKDNVDIVVHLGDYIYEHRNAGYGSGTSLGRVPQPWDRDIVELEDYRLRYASYCHDFDLRLSHETFPWVATWDDHEVTDNSWKNGAANHNSTLQGPYSVRKMNAIKAYFEWIPIRQLDLSGKVGRSFSIGNLFDLIMIDTRHWGRDLTDIYSNTALVGNMSTWTNRTMEGFDQEWWIKDTLSDSKQRGSKWRGDNFDAWNGYVASRQRLINRIKDEKIENVVILSGDIHSNWVLDIRDTEGSYDPTTGDGSYGVEFVGSAVSSPSPFASKGQNGAELSAKIMVNQTALLQWSEAWYLGYFVLTVSTDAVFADYFALNISTRNNNEIKSASFEVMAGANRLTRGYTKSILGTQKLL